MVQLKIVSAAIEGQTVGVDPDTTIADTRAMVGGIVGLEVACIKLNFRGKLLQDDELTWGALSPFEGEKIYVAADTSARSQQAMNTHGDVNLLRTYREGGHTAPPSAQQLRNSGGMPAMSPEMQQMMLNSISPAMIDMMFNMQPELRALQRDHPEVARELRDPENFRNMMRAQMDPTSRRANHQSQAMQLAQLSNIEGGWQAAERMMHSLQRDDSVEGESSPSMSRPMAAPGSIRDDDRTAPPPYPYAEQLRMLQDMGFESDVCRLALDQANGDVDTAVNLIAEWGGDDA